MRQDGKHHARRHWARWLAGAGAVLTGVATILLFAATSQPGWYRPARVEPSEYATIRNEIPNFGSNIGTHMERGQPFRIVVQDEDVNRWLAARGEIWPGLDGALPDNLSDPVISFQPGRIVLGVRYSESGFSSVLSLGVGLEVEDNRGAIRVKVDGLRAGHLPVPRALVDGRVREALDREAGRYLNGLMRKLWSQAAEYVPVGEIGRVGEGSAVGSVPLAAMLGDIWEFRLPTRSRWPNGGFLYTVMDIRIQQGKLTVDVAPVARGEDG